jgi:hypothetical protein
MTFARRPIQLAPPSPPVGPFSSPPLDVEMPTARLASLLQHPPSVGVERGRRVGGGGLNHGV